MHCLYGVEATLTNGRGTQIIPRVRLPALTLDGRTAPDIFPLPTPGIGVEMARQVQDMMSGVRPMTEAERIAENARHLAQGEADEREHQRLNTEAAARAAAHEVERRQLASGER